MFSPFLNKETYVKQKIVNKTKINKHKSDSLTENGNQIPNSLRESKYS